MPATMTASTVDDGIAWLADMGQIRTIAGAELEMSGLPTWRGQTWVAVPGIHGKTTDSIVQSLLGSALRFTPHTRGDNNAAQMLGRVLLSNPRWCTSAIPLRSLPPRPRLMCPRW